MFPIPNPPASLYHPSGSSQCTSPKQPVLEIQEGLMLKLIIPGLRSVQLSSVAQSCPTLCNPMDCSTPGLPAHHQLPEFTQTHVHWVGDAIQPSHSPPTFIFPSIRVFCNESALHIRWSNYWSFSFSISPSNEYSGLISFRIDWLDILAVQGNLECSPTPQFKNISSSALSFLYSPTLISIQDYLENHSFDYMDICRQSNVSV